MPNIYCMGPKEFFDSLDAAVRASLGPDFAFSVAKEGDRREYAYQGMLVSAGMYDDARGFIDGIMASPDPGASQIKGDRRLFEGPHHNRIFPLNEASLEFATECVRAWLSLDATAIQTLRNAAFNSG